MGLSAARVLAERGHSVIALDRQPVASAEGSSSGTSRIFRLSHTDREFVALAQNALDGWRRLEQRTNTTLLLRHGLLERGAASFAVGEALAASDVEHRLMDEHEVASLFPELTPRRGEPALFQPDAGTLLARESLHAQEMLARDADVEFVIGETATAVSALPAGVRVTTNERRIESDVAVVCAGPWTSDLLHPNDLIPPLLSETIQVTYFECAPETQHRPCLIDWPSPAGEPPTYGLALPGVGYKLGFVRARPWAPGEQPGVDPEEERALTARAQASYPSLGKPVRTESCPITSTADGLFVFDRVGPIVVGCGCNGQAFKFSPVIGEALADLAEDRPTDPRWTRFNAARAGAQMQPTSFAQVLASPPTKDGADRLAE